MANVIFAKAPKLMNISFIIANSRTLFAQLYPRRCTWKSWELYPLSFTPLALRSKASVQTCRRPKTSHIVIPFYGTRFTTMPLGIFGRPGVRPNSSRKSVTHSKQDCRSTTSTIQLIRSDPRDEPGTTVDSRTFFFGLGFGY